MAKIEIYDPPMCCSSGVCGPSVNSELVEFQANVTFLKNNNVDVSRFNLGHQPDSFLKNPKIVEAMGAAGENLPIILVDGEICSQGKYPTREELFAWAKIDPQLASNKQRNNLKIL